MNLIQDQNQFDKFLIYKFKSKLEKMGIEKVNELFESTLDNILLEGSDDTTRKESKDWNVN